MGLPSEPVTLKVEELDQLQQKLATLRHDVNNHLSLIMAVVELIRHKPEAAQRLITTLAEQPPKINQAIITFSAEFDRALGITRP
jgi:aspartokinase